MFPKIVCLRHFTKTDNTYCSCLLQRHWAHQRINCTVVLKFTSTRPLLNVSRNFYSLASWSITPRPAGTIYQPPGTLMPAAHKISKSEQSSYRNTYDARTRATNSVYGTEWKCNAWRLMHFITFISSLTVADCVVRHWEAASVGHADCDLLVDTILSSDGGGHQAAQAVGTSLTASQGGEGIATRPAGGLRCLGIRKARTQWVDAARSLGFIGSSDDEEHHHARGSQLSLGRHRYLTLPQIHSNFWKIFLGLVSGNAVANEIKYFTMQGCVLLQTAVGFYIWDLGRLTLELWQPAVVGGDVSVSLASPYDKFEFFFLLLKLINAS